MKKFWIVFIVLALFIGGGFGLLYHLMSSFEDTISIEGGALVWQVGGSYPEEVDESFWGKVQGRGQVSMFEVLFALHRAAEDDRISGLVLDIGGLELDWAKIEELRQAVAVFRESGKPVIAYLDGAGTREYALAASAELVAMSPEANLMVLGVTAQLDFLKDILDKLGMEADFIHVGKYKSAPERMTRTESTDANREMIAAIVDDRYEALVHMFADSRQIGTERIRELIDQGMFDTQGALAAGLVDTALYYDQLLDLYFDSEETTRLVDYALEGSRSSRARGKVALVMVSGVIMPGKSRHDNFQGKLAGSETVVEHLQAAGDDPDIGAVILRVDSPGGSALASDLIWHEIRRVQQDKPVIVSMSGLAASGGYYVACPADSIFADPGTLTGSIGVYAGKMSRTGMYDKIGINREFITRGENALLMSDEGGFSKGQRELFLTQMTDFYIRFLDKVAEGRGMSRDEVHAVAQGRVWTGNQALAEGLVDGLGGLHRAVTSAKYMLGLDPTDKVSIVTMGAKRSFLERMLIRTLRDSGGMGGMGRLGNPDSALPSALQGHDLVTGGLLDQLRRDGTLAAVSLLDGRPVAMMPYCIRVR